MLRLSCLALVLVSAPAVATVTAQTTQQEILFEEMWKGKGAGGKWSHSTNGTWMEDQTNQQADFGKVDHLVKAKSFRFTRDPLNLTPGTYVAVARFVKFKDAVGAADINLEVTSAAGKQVLTTTIAEQKANTWLHTKALLFTVRTATPALFELKNKTTSTADIENYYFDSFHLGKVHDKVVHYESLQRRWGYAWKGSVHFAPNQRDMDSAFGFVESIPARGASNLWWFDWTRVIPIATTGTHTANIRIKKVQSIAGVAPFKLWVDEDVNGTWTKRDEVIFDTKLQVVDKYVLSPNLTFDVTNANTRFRFKWQHIGGFAKQLYRFDAFMIRRGSYELFGQSCKSSAGDSTLMATIPQIGTPMKIEIGTIPSSPGIAALLWGVRRINLDATSAGFPGCFLYTSPIWSQGVRGVNGVGTVTLPIPNNPFLIGLKFLQQGVVLDPKANAGGAASTRGANALIQG